MVANFSRQTVASNPSIQAVVDWLLSQNLPPLPVAPQQNPREYPKVVKADPQQQIWEHCPLNSELQPIPLFSGKNPSFLDRHGIPHLINHRRYQSSMPSGSDMRKWFANPVNGIGTLGGHGGVIWLDFDVKQFGSEVECSTAVEAWVESHPELKGTFCERTQSGGWRIGVRVKHKTDFTNFALSPGGHHVGEALGAGRFTVLAPTIGPSGNAYRSINRTQILEVESLGAIDIYPSGKSFQLSDSISSPQPSLTVMPGSIPLDMLLNDQARAILGGENPTGDRSQALTILIREAYGWENWANTNDVAIRDSAEILAHAAGNALSLDSDRVGRILKTIDAASCHPAAAYKGDSLSCWLKIRRLDKLTFSAKCPQFIKDTISLESRSNSSANDSKGRSNDVSCKVINHPALSQLTSSELLQEVDRLIEQGLSQAQLEASIPGLAKRSGYTDQAVWRLYRERLKEVEIRENRDDTSEQVRQLLEANVESLDISTVLPDGLAKPIKQLASWLNLRPECYLTALLATVSSLHDVETYVTLLEKTDFDVTPNLFAAIVAESSQKKSPIFKAMVTRPLGVLREHARLEYNQAMVAYNATMEQYNNLKGEEKKQAFPDGPPKEPKLRIFSFTHTTGEGLLAQVQSHPTKGLLWESDELAGALKSANSYRGGRGSDEEDLLSFYDGTGATVLRANGVRADLRGLLLGIVGTIQPSILEKLAGDCTDGNGKWARFMFAHQPLAACEILDDSGSLNITPMLADLYERIDQLPAKAYKLSPDAKQYFLDCRNKIDHKRVNDPNPAMRAVWGKTEGRIGKIALNLHVIQEVFTGRTPSEVIPLDIIVAAARLAKFYANQIQSLYFQFATAEQALAPNLTKVIELSKRKGWIKPKDLQLTSNSKNRPSPDTVRGWFKELVAMGRGQIRGVGRSIEFSVESVDPKVDKSRLKVDRESTATSPSIVELQPKVDKVDKVDLPLDSILTTATATSGGGINNLVDLGSSGSTKLDLESTKSTLSTLGSNTELVGDTVVDSLSTFESTLSTLESTEAKVDENQLVSATDTPSIDETPDDDDHPPDNGGGGSSALPTPRPNDGGDGTDANAPSAVVQPNPNDEWLIPESLSYIAATLEECESKEMLAFLRQPWPKHALIAASKFLKPAVYQQVMQWAVELNAQSDPPVVDSVPSTSAVKLKPGMWVHCLDGFYGHLGTQAQDGRWWVVSPKTRKVDAKSRLYAAIDIYPVATQ